MSHPKASFASSTRRALVLVAGAVLVASAGCAKVDARSNAAGRGSAAARIGADARQAAAAGAAVLPEEYRAIRAVGVDDALPAIPPSETWPAQ